MKFQTKGKWKSIPMPHTFFGNGDDSAMCGGIDVLEDYSINKKTIPVSTQKIKSDSSPSVNIAKKRKNNFEVNDIIPAKKTKTEKVSGVTLPEVSPDKNSKAEKKKKKNKKKSKNKPAVNLAMLNKVCQEKTEKANSLSQDKTEKVSKISQDRTEIAEHQAKSKDPTNTRKSAKVEDPNDKSEKLSAEKKEGSKSKEGTDMSEWRDLFVCDEIIQALQEKGFASPTPIQRLTLPAALKGRMDIVGAAETGSGKTLAFAIPIVQGILNDRRKDAERRDVDVETPDEPAEEGEEQDTELEELHVGKKRGDKLRALILTPTRELAMQIKNHIQDILVATDISVTVLVGGISAEKQLRLLKRRPEIVVATPGRLWDLVQEGVPHLSSLADIRYLAIDETDRMGEKGHFDELQKLLEMMKAEAEGFRQNFVMSATLSLVHKPPAYKKGKKNKQKTSKEKMKDLMEFVGVSERRKVVDITRKAGTAESLTESVIHCSLEEKDAYLYYFIKSHKGRTIVFCNSIDCVRRLGNLFSYLETKPLPLHAQLHQKQRLKNLERFSSLESGLLIATDVAARGLDIPNIEHVVHYQVPRTSESYIHRSGRTARANKSGLSVLLVDPTELYLYKKLCATLTKTADLPRFPVDSSRFGMIMMRMESARKYDKLMLQARKKSVGENWMQKAAEDADILLSEDEDSDTDKGQEAAVERQKIRDAKRELQIMLRTPLIVSDFSGRYPTESGSLPMKIFNPSDLNAVQTLEHNISSTENILKKKKKLKGPGNSDRKFKGFKKKKLNKKSD